MSYYDEKRKAGLHAKRLLEEILFIKQGEINLEKLEELTRYKYGCNYMSEFFIALRDLQKSDDTVINQDGIITIKPTGDKNVRGKGKPEDFASLVARD